MSERFKINVRLDTATQERVKALFRKEAAREVAHGKLHRWEGAEAIRAWFRSNNATCEDAKVAALRIADSSEGSHRRAAEATAWIAGGCQGGTSQMPNMRFFDFHHAVRPSLYCPAIEWKEERALAIADRMTWDDHPEAALRTSHARRHPEFIHDLEHLLGDDCKVSEELIWGWAEGLEDSEDPDVSLTEERRGYRLAKDDPWKMDRALTRDLFYAAQISTSAVLFTGYSLGSNAGGGQWLAIGCEDGRSFTYKRSTYHVNTQLGSRPTPGKYPIGWGEALNVLRKRGVMKTTSDPGRSALGAAMAMAG